MLSRANDESKFSADLLRWYDAHRRHLPWRGAPGAPVDPYAVWLSEIMLQQTGVSTVIRYFEAFLAKWPRVEDLAAASSDEVMRAWAGLGYYSRARNLHACAKAVAQAHGGRFPSAEADLLRLPGIGPYTAAAISAIAFGRRAVVVDGNVERVIARAFAIATPKPQAMPAIRDAADSVTPRLRAGDFAQAMMDLGATICAPRAPACAICPVRPHCAACREGAPTAYPVKAGKAARPRRFGAAFYIRHEGAVLLRRRPPRGLLGGMMEFPGTEWGPAFDADACVFPPGRRRHAGEVRHAFTHFGLTLQVYVVDAASADAPADARWTREADLAQEALPTLMRKVALQARGPA